MGRRNDDSLLNVEGRITQRRLVGPLARKTNDRLLLCSYSVWQYAALLGSLGLTVVGVINIWKPYTTVYASVICELLIWSFYLPALIVTVRQAWLRNSARLWNSGGCCNTSWNTADRAGGNRLDSQAGFTGGTGGSVTIDQLLNWTYVPGMR